MLQVSKENKLPKQLCQQCFNDFTNCHTFIDKYQRSEQTLISLSNQIETALKTESIETQLNEIRHKIAVKDSSTVFSETSESPLQTQPNSLVLLACDQDKTVQVNKLVPLNKKRWRCELCGKTLRKPSTLRVHACMLSQELTVHETEKPYNCGFCGKGFKTQRHLTIHETTHKEEKPWKCALCEKSFMRKEHLTVHERIHTGERPYTCEVCNKSYSQKGDFNRHSSTHLDEKPHRCGFCTKKFSTRQQQVRHERLHTGRKPYSCGMCNKSFPHKSSLTCHLNTHLREKPYKCGFCGKDFSTKQVQIRHEKIHAREKPYTCKVCKSTTKGVHLFKEGLC